VSRLHHWRSVPFFRSTREVPARSKSGFRNRRVRYALLLNSITLGSGSGDSRSGGMLSKRTVFASLDMITTPDGELVALTGIECGNYHFSWFQPVLSRYFSTQAISSVAVCFVLYRHSVTTM
jgi:hypothetical protein